MTKFCSRIRATNLAVLDLEGEERAKDIIVAECCLALEEDECGAIVLGCAGMADLADSISLELGIPVIDGVRIAVKFVEALVGTGLKTSKAGDLAFPLAKLEK